MKDINFLKDKIIAHRGYHNIKENIPENSILAFKKAIRYKYVIELDVHILEDNTLVVFHDDNLKRVCGVDKNIDECTFDEIKDLKLFNTTCKIPLFEEVLKEVDGKVPLLIETKMLKYNSILEQELSKILDNYNGLFAIQSFNPFSINWFKNNKKNYIIGLLSSNFKKWNLCYPKKIIGKTLLLDLFLKVDFIAFDLKAMPNKYIDKKKNKKLVLGWTIRCKEDYENANKYFDNIICENMNDYIK